MKRTDLALILLLLTGACSTRTSAPGSATTTAVPAAAIGPGGATCTSVCARAKALDCPIARPTPGGAPCETVCENAQRGAAPWRLDCRTTAASCDAADACEVPR